jgi:hypothetical protein
MSKYRKKPIVIEAFKYFVDKRPEWFVDAIAGYIITPFQKYCEIKTLEGIMRAEVGDYIIKGIKGEIYPCKSDIFESTYEKEG